MNYGGVIYQALSVGGLLLLAAAILGVWTYTDRRKNAAKAGKNKVKRNFVIALICGILGAVYMCVLLVFAAVPSVDSLRGSFVEQRRTSRGVVLPFTYEYVFENEDKKTVLRLDAFSKKAVFPDDFLEGRDYCVYYDSRTKIIVKVEAADE